MTGDKQPTPMDEDRKKMIEWVDKRIDLMKGCIEANAKMIVSPDLLEIHSSASKANIDEYELLQGIKRALMQPVTVEE